MGKVVSRWKAIIDQDIVSTLWVWKVRYALMVQGMSNKAPL